MIGNSAKYCSYTVMNHATDEIVHIEVVDKREVGLKLPNMERLGLIRSLQYMESGGAGG